MHRKEIKHQTNDKMKTNDTNAFNSTLSSGTVSSEQAANRSHPTTRRGALRSLLKFAGKGLLVGCLLVMTSKVQAVNPIALGGEWTVWNGPEAGQLRIIKGGSSIASVYLDNDTWVGWFAFTGPNSFNCVPSQYVNPAYWNSVGGSGTVSDDLRTLTFANGIIWRRN